MKYIDCPGEGGYSGHRNPFEVEPYGVSGGGARVGSNLNGSREFRYGRRAPEITQEDTENDLVVRAEVGAFALFMMERRLAQAQGHIIDSEDRRGIIDDLTLRDMWSFTPDEMKQVVSIIGEDGLQEIKNRGLEENPSVYSPDKS